MTIKLSYAEKQSKARKEQKNGLTLRQKRFIRIKEAVETAPPGSPSRPATHEQVMAYLRDVLIPGLADIAKLVELNSKQHLTREDLKSFSIVRERVSNIMRTRHPRNQDAPLMLVRRLLLVTKSVSPAEVDDLLTKYYI